MNNTAEKYVTEDALAHCTLSATALDGYLTAIITGPCLLVPSAWLPSILPEDSFTDKAEAELVLGEIMRRYNAIARQLEPIPEAYHPPYLPKDATHPDALQHAGEWAEGFWKAMRLNLPDWSFMIEDETGRMMLGPVLGFVEENGSPLLEMPPDEREQALREAIPLIPLTIPAIKTFWQEYDYEVPQPIRSSKQGRNDTCACGSGKKYKRCCGAN